MKNLSAKILVPVLAGISFISGIAYNSCNSSKEQMKIIEKCCEKPDKTATKRPTQRHIQKKINKPAETPKNIVDYNKEREHFGPVNAEFYIFNYWDDKNKSNTAEEDELIGIKNRFYSNEKITFGSSIKNRLGSRVDGKILNWEGKVMARFNRGVNFNKCFSYTTYNVSDFLQKGGEGTYTIQWYLDNKFIGQKKFDLIN